MSDRCEIHDVCEGGSLHIRGRDAKGCAQFQDGSWLTKNADVCWGTHPGLGKDAGLGRATRDWLEGEFAKVRR